LVSIYDVVHSELISKEVTQIVLRPSSESRLVYQAGQYLKIVHPDGKISPLSIANAPQENGLIELQLAHPAAYLLAQEILRFVAEEKKLIVRGPYGNCTAEKFSAQSHVILLARGTGFAPIKAMLEEVQKNKKSPHIHFYWSVTSPEEFYLDELLAEWERVIPHFTYTPVLSRDYFQWQGRVGLLQKVVLEDYPEIARHWVYASAPESIVHDVLHALQERGLPRDQYYSDVFDYDARE